MHCAQIADNLETLSAIGTNVRILLNGFLSNVPSKAAIITIIPLLAKSSAI